MESETPEERTRHQFELLDDGTMLDITFRRLIIAGYTGRDPANVAAHIEELAAIGIAPPETVPMFYEVPCDLIAPGSRIGVAGDITTGEVEPVIVKYRGAFYLGVGSDHTDRLLEAESVAASKAACPKPIGQSLLPLAGAVDDWPWDDIHITCYVDGRLYQDGALSCLRHPSDLLARLGYSPEELPDGTAIYAGTVPLHGSEFLAGECWELNLTTESGKTISHTYTVHKE